MFVSRTWLLLDASILGNPSPAATPAPAISMNSNGKTGKSYPICAIRQKQRSFCVLYTVVADYDTTEYKTVGHSMTLPLSMHTTVAYLKLYIFPDSTLNSEIQVCS